MRMLESSIEAYTASGKNIITFENCFQPLTCYILRTFPRQIEGNASQIHGTRSLLCDLKCPPIQRSVAKAVTTRSTLNYLDMT